jgi:hypothetical protein
MFAAPPEDKIAQLEAQANIWFGSVRPDGRPHLTPVWFVWHTDHIYIGIDPNGVKSRNLQNNPKVVLALEDGTHPLICEGEARLIQPPYRDGLLGAFLAKYDWDMMAEKQFHQVIEVTPIKWLSW